MASPVVMTTDDLLRKVGSLQMECELRGRREDELAAEVARLRAELAALTESPALAKGH